MNQNSLSAYFDESNQKKFKSHKAKIVRELSKRPNQHSYLLAHRIGLTNEATKKRLTDLLQENVIEISDNEIYYGNQVSIYKLRDQLSMFPKNKKPTLRKWLKQYFPDILKKYDESTN